MSSAPSVVNWKEEIVKLVYIKQALAAADNGCLYPSFSEFFLAMMDYNRLGIAKLQKA